MTVHSTPDARRGDARRCVALCFAALMLACAGTPDQGGEGSAADPVVARVGDTTISLSEVDRALKDALFEERFGGNYRARLYDARNETLQRMIDDQLVADAARAAGLTEAEWIDARVAEQDPVSDEAIANFFEANREQIGTDVSLESVAERIRRHLERRQEQAVVAALRDEQDVEIALARERFDVPAIGPSRGPEDARVTIVEFSDYQCPYCARAEPTLRTLLERYPDDIRLVYRHLPLDFHPNAFGAAVAAVCADAQGQFWAYHDLLFANQDKLDGPSLAAFAAQLGLDADAFAVCLDAPESTALVRRDVQAAQALGASGTPAFYINGVFMSGAQPIERFEARLAAEGVETRR